MTIIISLVLALAIDRLIGWPDWLFRRISHPVVAIGQLISWHDRHLNQVRFSSLARRLLGVVTVIIIGLFSLAVAMIPEVFALSGTTEIIVMALLAWPFIAAKSLKDHVKQVADPLVQNDCDKARQSVAMIVGRNAAQLDETGIARASLESLAENTSDGIIAPLFWGALFGLPGIILYKAINTMDSMIGYRNEKYEAFGWCAARLDDVVNYMPARLTAFLYVIASKRPFYVLKIVMRDATKHRSPNAGWPESALAASLNVSLSGPRIYDGVPSQDAWLHEEGDKPNGQDIFTAIGIYDVVLNWLMAMAMAAILIGLLYDIG